MDLTKNNANKITCVNNGSVVTLPSGVFAQGDMLMLFNNSDEVITLCSEVDATYRSGNKVKIKTLQWPARALVNVVFVEESLAVVTVEDC